MAQLVHGNGTIIQRSYAAYPGLDAHVLHQFILNFALLHVHYVHCMPCVFIQVLDLQDRVQAAGNALLVHSNLHGCGNNWCLITGDNSFSLPFNPTQLGQTSILEAQT